MADYGLFPKRIQCDVVFFDSSLDFYQLRVYIYAVISTQQL